MRRHRPVMPTEVLEYLKIEPGSVVVDGTVGHGGHAELMLKAAGESGTLIAFDWDEEMIRKSIDNLRLIEGDKTFVNADYRDIPEYLFLNGREGVDAILLDCGVNLEHFEDPDRGFSFNLDSPLDMRMSRATRETAAAWLNRATHGEIAAVLREFGGERHASAIAKQIVSRRKEGRMKRTLDLVEAVLSAVPPRLREKRIHPATRTFQAVRIQVNKELESLDEAIANIALSLKPGGRMVTLSYHSGEDGAAKRAFKSLSKQGEVSILTKKPVKPSEQEIEENPNSRSAKLRAIERIKKEEQI